jgi:thioredoxin-dependent peroxiredoxin
MKKFPKGTTRGVFVVDKTGKVLAAEPGGPQATVDVVKRVVEELGGSKEEVKSTGDLANEPSKEDKEAADTAAAVADTAAKVDGEASADTTKEKAAAT